MKEIKQIAQYMAIGAIGVVTSYFLTKYNPHLRAVIDAINLFLFYLLGIYHGKS